ncbi:putative bifunctional diguanylate cyclase/phosphodiesterase [Wenzhouxiangella limi]|uniref:EAL domain-containing protein n=1 Tax=Wenzhouxiangella limi TaxID=2707351 RepID=A0A845UZF8_9GAMM|nr:EAL domain-containing protein [Wenzhouxiangella limi]NDY95864.1 EAL domain-containing protein [Wenzhouxiangella limi]
MPIEQQPDLRIDGECLPISPYALEDVWQKALEAFHGSVVITDVSGTIVYANTRCQEISGYSAAELIGKRTNIFRSGRVVDWTYKTLWSTISQGGTWRGILINKKKSGEEYAEYVNISPIKAPDGDIIGYIAFKELLTHEQSEQRQVEKLVSYDPLTELPNRDYLQRTISERLANVAANGATADFYFLIIDIDNFHALNANVGAEQADCFLSEYARRLLSFVGEDGFVGRLGSDEFGIILDADVLSDIDVTGPVTNWVTELQRDLNRPMWITGGQTAASASIGMTKAPIQGNETSSDVMWRANQALKKAKKTGDQAEAILAVEEQSGSRHQRALQSDLLGAIENNDIQLYLQAIVDQSGGLMAAEALARWVTPDKTVIPPNVFLNAARQLGKMGCLTRQLIAQLIDFQKAAFASGTAVPISLNVESREYLSTEFNTHLVDGIVQSGLPPRLFKIELTEGSIVNDLDAVTRRMKTLRAFGIRHSLDDFGTGYSSLSHLADLPIDEVKIDRSFVRWLPFHRSSRSICRSICSIARELSIDIVAEGVEKTDHAGFFRDWEDTRLQGFLFDRPASMESWRAKWL